MVLKMAEKDCRKRGSTSRLDCDTLADLLKTKSNIKIKAFSSSYTIAEAFKQLSENHILSAPVLMESNIEVTHDGLKEDELELANSSAPILGFIDVSSLMSLYITIASKDFNMLKDATDFSDLANCLGRAAERFGEMQVLNAIATDGGLLRITKHGGEADLSLREIITTSFLSSYSDLVYHRVAVTNCDGLIIKMVSQTDLVTYFNLHRDILGSNREKTIEELSLGNSNVFTVSELSPVFSSFASLHRRNISAAAVVNERGCLVGNLSVSDLRGMSISQFSDLALPVKDFLLNDQSSSIQDMVTTSIEATLENVVELLSEARVHRVYVVDAARIPIVVITLTDVIRLLVTS